MQHLGKHITQWHLYSGHISNTSIARDQKAGSQEWGITKQYVLTLFQTIAIQIRTQDWVGKEEGENGISGLQVFQPEKPNFRGFFVFVFVLFFRSSKCITESKTQWKESCNTLLENTKHLKSSGRLSYLALFAIEVELMLRDSHLPDTFCKLMCCREPCMNVDVTRAERSPAHRDPEDRAWHVICSWTFY